jgi:hypothetical protein
VEDDLANNIKYTEMEMLDVNTKLKTSTLWTGGMHSAKCDKRQT